MKINPIKFLEALETLKVGISTTGIVEQLMCVDFTGKAALTSSGEVSVHFPFETDFEGMVRVEELIGVLQGVKEEEVEVHVEGDTLLVSTGSVKAGLSLVQGDRVELDFSDGSWLPLPADFVKGTLFCSFSTSKDVMRRAFTCVCIDGQYIFSTEDYRMTMYRLKDSIGIPSRLLIPAVSVLLLAKFPVVRFCKGESWIHFQTSSGVVFSCRLVRGDFPVQESHFDVQGVRFQLPKELRDVVKHVSVFTPGELELDKEMEITVGDRKLVCRSARETGWIERTVGVRYNRKTVTFRVNPVFLYQILEKESVTVEVAENSALFSGEYFKHWMALVI